MPQQRPEHIPIGDPCRDCGLPAAVHRKRKRPARQPEHKPEGDPCSICKRLASEHRSRAKRPYVKREYKYEARDILGVDGEGFEHGSVYAYMAASSKTHEVSTVERIQGKGLSTVQCLDFLLDLPKKPLKFGFSLGYDYTKILADLDNESLWLLNHVEERMAKAGPPRPIVWWPKNWQAGDCVYEINLLSSRLAVRRLEGHKADCDDLRCKSCKAVARTVIWDCFKFFQTSFIKACLDWGVISKEEYEILARMKGMRSEFKRPKSENDPEWLEVKMYCGLECRKMADLAERLLQAHTDAGLKLTQYFGAGSTGAAMLDKMNARQFIREEFHPTDKKTGKQVAKAVWLAIQYQPALLNAIACSFFGGRFEISRVGPYIGTVWSYDISSAYPYAFTFLPCLSHGKWERRSYHAGLQGEIERASAAIVRYELPYVRGLGRINRAGWGEPWMGEHRGESDRSWGPLPFRDQNGNIIYPVTSGGGWIHKSEFLTAQKHYPNVKLIEAWVYNTPCSCRVLRDVMPENYKLRCSWGKEGKGQVAKLGQNACYGKTAQSKGKNPPYQSFIWAGMTTASCRSQVLEAIALASAPENIITIATDGIMSTERLTLPPPDDTGTYDTLDIKSGKKKPLGGWEEKEVPAGMMLIRPGIVFSFGDDFKETKARGIGKSVLDSRCGEVMNSWYTRGEVDLEVRKSLFFGMKGQLDRVPRPDGGYEYRRRKTYGTFGEVVQKISYFAHPKRPVGTLPGTQRYRTWALEPNKTSQPYKAILGEEGGLSDEMRVLRQEKFEDMDQPDYEDLLEDFDNE
jgi:hypothetical protein